jgi:hypothetical protein
MLLLTLALGATFASAVAPTVTIDAPSGVSYTSAHVAGTVDPGDKDTTYEFQYSRNPGSEGWSSAGTQGPLAAGSGVANVADDLEGLQPGTEYFTRLVAENSDGQATSGEPGPTFTTLAVAPPTVSLNAPSAITSESAHIQATINPGAPAGNPSAFDVHWKISCLPGCSIKEGDIPADAVDHTVFVDLVNLTPNVSYEVTMTAENAGGSVKREVTFKTPGAAPTVATAPVIADVDGAFQMRGSVNAHNAPATYFFELSTRPDFVGAISVPAGKDATVPTDTTPNIPVEVTAWATGLQVSTTYYYRVNAQNQFGSGQGSGLSFTTRAAEPPQACGNELVREQQSAEFLDDCRAWEMVSPVNKHGYQVGGNYFVGSVQLGVAPSGANVVYSGVFPLGESDSGSAAGLSAMRTGSGWANESVIGRPGPNQTGMGFPGFDAVLRGSTPDGRTSVYWDATTEPYGSLWVRRADGSTVRIADASQQGFAQGPGTYPGQPWFEGISPDGKHVVFADTDALLPGISSSGNDILYEWVDDGANGGAGTLRLVNRTNAASPTLIGSASASLGGSVPRELGNANFRGEGLYALGDAISANGSRIIFQTPAPALVNVSFPGGGGPVYMRENGTETIEVSAPETGYTPANPATVYQYVDASENGRYVFFYANGDLTSDADSSGGVYRFDVSDRSLELVTSLGAASAMPSGLASADGSKLYFQYSSGIGVVLWDEGQLVDLGNAASTGFWQGGGESAQTSPWVSDTTCVSANVSRSGRFFVFTGLDSEGNPQVYRYDADSDQLRQLTAAPEGAGFLSIGSCGGGLFPQATAARAMSEDAQRIFFDTKASLSPQDTNDLLDAYEWNQGRISLLSNGKSSDESKFAGTDETGTNAFILTQSALAPEDGDQLYDLYDVRAGGGFPTSSRPICGGEGCQGPASSQPSTPSAGTADFSGPGNPQAQRKVKKHKKKHARKGKRHQRSHKKGHKKAHKGKGGNR